MQGKSQIGSSRVAENVPLSVPSHTPTPWYINLDEQECLIVSGVKSPDGDGLCLVSDMYRGGYDYEEFGFTARANAAFIVRACNSHDTLVKALEHIVGGIKCGGIVASDPLFDAKLKKNLKTAEAALASSREVRS